MSVDTPTRSGGDRTTFQRVYDALTGVSEPVSASEFADRASCSENGARDALDQLVEMGIATRTDGRPARYGRNDAYFEWRRVESLVEDHPPDELRSRLSELLEADERFREQYGVPDPDAVSSTDVGLTDGEALEERWDDVREWRTVRRDVRLLRRAVDRAERRGDAVP